MNYLRTYCKLIRKEEAKGLTKKEAKKQGLYVEGHHVFPCSVYGNSKSGNNRIVYVSARVHYILHALLEKGFIKRYGLYHPKSLKMCYAHTKMKSSTENKRYINSYLYENSRKRLSQLLKGTKRPKNVGESVSKARKGNYKGRDNPSTVSIRVYFDDGRVIEYYDGIRNFAKEYGYSLSSIGSFIRKKWKKHKNIIKIEKFKVEKPKKEKIYVGCPRGRKCKMTIPIRIYFADGRIEECIDGAPEFCRQNPEYDPRHIGDIRKGVRALSRDIVKVDDMRIHKEASKPIVKKYYNRNYVPLKIYFEDGRVVISEKGATEFCRQNPNYRSNSISKVGRGIKSRYKDIIKVERLVDC